MPWQSARETKETIAKAIQEAVTDTKNKIKEVSDRLEKIDARVDGVVKSLEAIEDAMALMKRHGERESKKLSSVIEGAVRAVLLTERGREYIKSRKVSSVHDVVLYLKDLMGESDNWLARVQSDITDYLLQEVSKCIPRKHTHSC